MAEIHEQAEREHADAMRHANDGFAHRYLGDEAEALAAFRTAWEHERRAAMSLLGEDLEPSRSILFRSAASLALLCSEHEDARRLAHLGLAGSPSKRVREALETVLAEAEAHIVARRRPREDNDLRGELHKFPGVLHFGEPPTSRWEQVA